MSKTLQTASRNLGKRWWNLTTSQQGDSRWGRFWRCWGVDVWAQEPCGFAGLDSGSAASAGHPISNSLRTWDPQKQLLLGPGLIPPGALGCCLAPAYLEEVSGLQLPWWGPPSQPHHILFVLSRQSSQSNKKFEPAVWCSGHSLDITLCPHFLFASPVDTSMHSLTHDVQGVEWNVREWEEGNMKEMRGKAERKRNAEGRRSTGASESLWWRWLTWDALCPSFT